MVLGQEAASVPVPGGGVGAGHGAGVGPGSGGGIGGGVFKVGGGISAPQPVSTPDPEYTEEARRAKSQGNLHPFG
jgi:protein TonB